VLSLALRNAFSDPSRYGAELSWTFPLAGRLHGMLQWFSGYGENLIDYNHAHQRIGIGITFDNWL
jgi:phospholipase A1